jgi:DnaJ-class molecular chaperone
MERSKKKCPECKGTGCDPEPLKAPADDTEFLFPRCSLCRGKGMITVEQFEKYMKKKTRD